MRRPLVAGNWKMNGSRDSVAALIDQITAKSNGFQNVDIAVCPPYVYLDQVSQVAAGSAVAVGGQDLSIYAQGAYTGEISANMLLDMGAKCVIVGHSERRTYHQETDELVAQKANVAVEAGLMPLVCVGETLGQREANNTESVIAQQLDVFLQSDEGVATLASSVIAYEPVWAIGTGKTATPQQAQDVHRFIRGRIAERSGELADKIRILYGGSVNAGNAAELFAMPDIDGGLIGGASLKAEDFMVICAAANGK